MEQFGQEGEEGIEDNWRCGGVDGEVHKDMQGEGNSKDQYKHAYVHIVVSGQDKQPWHAEFEHDVRKLQAWIIKQPEGLSKRDA